MSRESHLVRAGGAREASAEEQRRERNRKKFEETELVDDVSSVPLLLSSEDGPKPTPFSIQNADLGIPELGDDGEGDITTQVAAPPKVTLNRGCRRSHSWTGTYSTTSQTRR